MFFDKIFNFKLYKNDIKYICGFIFIVGIAIYYSFKNLKEGLNVTSCSDYTDCLSCSNGPVNDLKSPCYWSLSAKKCGSFDDPGYSKKCDGTNPSAPTCSSQFKECRSFLVG